jgi:hypothetical protein
MLMIHKQNTAPAVLMAGISIFAGLSLVYGRITGYDPFFHSLVRDRLVAHILATIHHATVVFLWVLAFEGNIRPSLGKISWALVCCIGLIAFAFSLLLSKLSGIEPSDLFRFYLAQFGFYWTSICCLWLLFVINYTDRSLFLPVRTYAVIGFSSMFIALTIYCLKTKTIFSEMQIQLFEMMFGVIAPMYFLLAGAISNQSCSNLFVIFLRGFCLLGFIVAVAVGVWFR